MNSTFFASHSSYLNRSLPSYSSFLPCNSIPKLNCSTLMDYDLQHIPPLLTQDSLQKRLNLSDLGNPIQKKVKYNPETYFHVTQASHFSQNRQTITNTNQKPMKQISSQVSIKKHTNDQKSSHFDASTYLREHESFTQNVFIPKLANSNQVAKGNSQTADDLQQALQILKQKLVSPSIPSKNAQKQSAKLQQPGFAMENHPKAITNTKLASYGKPSFEKKLEASWNGSPLATTEDSVNSCSTSDLCESEQKACWAFELEPIIINPSQLASQLAFFASFGVAEDSLVMKPDFSNWSHGPKYVLASNGGNMQNKLADLTREVPLNNKTSLGFNHLAETSNLDLKWESTRITQYQNLNCDSSRLSEGKLRSFQKNSHYGDVHSKSRKNH